MDLYMNGYSYRGYEMGYALRKAREFGYRGVELRSFSDIDISTPETVTRTLERATPLLSDLDLAVCSVWYGPLAVSRADEFLAEEKAFCDVLGVLAQYGVPILHTHLSLLRADGWGEVISAGAVAADYEAVRRALDRVAPVAEREGVKIAIETHMGRIHDSAASLLRILTECPSAHIVACLDYANMLIVNPQESFAEKIQLFGSRIGYTHIKNVKLLPGGYDWNLSVRWGDVNYYRVFEALKKVGYGGACTVEYCGTGDPDVFVADDARYLNELAVRVGM